jgi:Domain of unknown function (DUF4174)
MSESLQSSIHLSPSNVFGGISPADRLEVEFSLSDYQWQHRVVLIFAPSERSPDYQHQMEQWNRSDGIQERELKLVEVLGTDEGSQVDGQRISPASAKHLRQQFGITEGDFAVILVGKDGTEKQRSLTPVEPSVVFRAIDAMPMRQQEMRDRQ